MIYIIAGVLIAGLIVYFLLKPKSKFDNYFVSTQSQSRDRVKNLGLDSISEDVSYILDENKLSFPSIKVEVKCKEYKPHIDKDWVIALKTVNGENLQKEDFSKIFDYEWRSNFQSTIYGFATEENRWTFANSGNSPQVYSELQVAIDVQDIFKDENPNYAPRKFERYIVELERRIEKYPTKLKIEQTESFESGIAKAKRLAQLQEEFKHDVIIVLQTDKQFKGLDVWDTLQSLGLKWGDGDWFHWQSNISYGHNEHFTVWTATQPGYFLPEDIKNGKMNPQNLVFGFSLPRSAAPINIFEIMTSSVKYAQKRLGGQILDRHLQSFNEEKERHNIAERLERMEQNGLKAGSDHTLRIF